MSYLNNEPAIYTAPNRRPNREATPVRTLFVLSSVIVDGRTWGQLGRGAGASDGSEAV